MPGVSMGFVCCDRQFLSDQAIEQGGLAYVWTANQANEASTGQGVLTISRRGCRRSKGDHAQETKVVSVQNCKKRRDYNDLLLGCKVLLRDFFR